MRLAILILAWITPAVIAGALGWSGIWGAGSALGDYLIPIPVAGGALHVPSFLVAAAFIFAASKVTGTFIRYLPVLAFSVLALAIALMIDFERLNAWAFTDYSPHGLPVRLDGNPFLLFVASDAFWVGVYALTRVASIPKVAWFALPVLPTIAVGISMANYHSSGPVFRLGGSMGTGQRGEEIVMVYTSASYNESVFRGWLEQDPYFARPWFNVNSEHVAIHFTNSMQAIKWGQFDQTEDTIATICLYEEDRSVHPHRGYYDCFADRNTVEQELAELAARESTGLGDDVDHWYARALLCDDVEIPEAAVTDIALIGVCKGAVGVYPRSLQRFVARYGEDSEQVRFVRAEAAARGLTEE
ncbi:MAG: hypothetical protein QNJ11_01900 [Woeseiaceae bacterium]|nr:hypothetical protein [Woeseiaceae bacterium]